MLRFYVPIAILGGVAALVACSGRDPVADNLNNGATAPAKAIPARMFGPELPLRWIG